MICIIEDDESIRNLIGYTLNAAEYKTLGFESGKDFFAYSKNKENPDLIMLDIMLPGEDGLRILEKLKLNEKYKNIPVIIISAKNTEYDKVKGLDLGADDYLAKPFGMLEMLSRVKALLRRSGKKEDSILKYENIVVDIPAHSVIVEGKIISLTLKEYKILVALMKNIDRVLTRENLLSIVWNVEVFYETRTIDVHIGTLRSKLGKSGKFIKTLRGVGYKLGK